MTIIQLGATAIEPQALGTNAAHAVKQPEYLASAQSENHSSIINPQVAALDPFATCRTARVRLGSSKPPSSAHTLVNVGGMKAKIRPVWNRDISI